MKYARIAQWLERLISNQIVLGSSPSSGAMERNVNIDFTYRQWEVYELFFNGYTYKEIALKLGLVYGSVSGHTFEMRKAAGVKTNQEMIKKIGNPPGWFTRYKCRERNNA